MAKQRFKPEERWALYSAFGGACIHCSELISYKYMKIDHIIPEHWATSPNRDSLLISFDLPIDFNILGFNNLAPSCEDCNTKKHQTPLFAGRTHILLGQISRKISKVKDIIEETRSLAALGKICALIETGLESERFTPIQASAAVQSSIREYQKSQSHQKPYTRARVKRIRDVLDRSNISASSTLRGIILTTEAQLQSQPWTARQLAGHPGVYEIQSRQSKISMLFKRDGNRATLIQIRENTKPVYQ